MIKSILAAAALAAISTGGIAQTTTPQTADHAAADHAPLPTINSTIKDLLANPATAAILEKHLPGISQHPVLPQIQDMTLAQVAPISQGKLTQAMIDAIDADLKALPAS
jgi:hypothetical protein